MKKLFSFFLMLSCVYCFAELTPSQVQREATKVSSNASFSAHMTASDGTRPASYQYYQQVSPDGVKYTLMKPLDKNGATSFLVNAKGRFEIIGNTAIRMDYAEKPRTTTSKLPIKKDENTFILDGEEVTREMVGDKNFARLERMAQGKFEESPKQSSEWPKIKQVNYHDIPCYLLQYKYTANDGMFMSEEIIDQRTFFTYQTKRFNPQGRLIAEMTYSDIVMDPVFEKSFFDLPAGTKVMIAKTIEERSKQSTTALNKANPSLQISRRPSSATSRISTWGTGVAGWFWNHSNVLSGILAIIAVGILIFAIIIKRKSKA